MTFARPTAAFIALVSVTLLSRDAAALSQTDVGNISCDVAMGYAATSPAYLDVFRAFLEGYLAGEKSSKPATDDSKVATLLTEVIEYCAVRRDASFASAVAATAK